MLLLRFPHVTLFVGRGEASFCLRLEQCFEASSEIPWLFFLTMSPSYLASLLTIEEALLMLLSFHVCWRSSLSGPLRLRVESRSRTWLRIAASIAFSFRACFRGVLDTIAPLSRG